MKAEFGRILGVDRPVKLISSKFKNLINKIIAFAGTQPVARDLISSVEEAIEENPTKKTGKKKVV